jgi:hypothetical protein
MKVLSNQLRLVCFAGFLCLLLLLPALLDRPVYQPALTVDHWLPGSEYFQWHAPPNADFVPRTIVRSPETRFWYNYSPGTGSTTGELRSKPFLLESTELYLPTFGFPNARQAGIYLESIADGRRFPANPGAAHEQWQAVANKFPASLLHTAVCLVAYSNAKDVAIGLGTPYYRINGSLPGVAFSELFGCALFAICYALLLLYPAFALMRHFTKLNTVESWLAAFVLTGVCSLGLFYCCHFSPVIARGLARLWLLCAVILAGLSLRRGIGAWRSSYSCLLIVALLTLFQACFVFSFRAVSPLYSANYLFYPASWTTDNQIPITVTQFLAEGLPLRDVPMGPWTVSDRTPLLSCFLFPAATLLRHFPHQIPYGLERTILQMCSFAVHNFWILPAWIFFRRLGVGSKDRIVALLLLAATPFVFYNTVYVWPKLLAATFCLVQYLYLSDRPASHASSSGRIFQIIIAGLAAGLAIMSHGAAAIAVGAIYLAAAFHAPWKHWFHLGLAGACSAAVAVPWVIWTRTVVPTTNPLPRFLLTADFGFTRTAPPGILEATVRMYRTMPFSAWLHAKLVALQTLAGWDTSIAQMSLALFKDPFAGLESVRAYQFFFLLPSLGLLLIPLGWLLLRPKPEKTFAPKGLVKSLAVAAVATFLLHFLVMMAPHVLHHYPYFLPLALHLLAVTAIMTRQSKLLRVIACLNYLAFLFYWIALILIRTPVRSIGGILCSLALVTVATIFIGRWALRSLLQPESRQELT